MIPSDPLEDILKPAALPTSPLKETLRARTTKAIRRSLWRRRLSLAAAAVLLFAAGMGTMAWLRPVVPAPAVVDRSPIDAPEKEREKDDAVATLEKNGQAGSPSYGERPLDLEMKAFDLPAPQKLELLLAAGQKYLNEEQDYESTLRCYRQVLEAGGEDMREINPEDDWLMMALKLDRQKEN